MKSQLFLHYASLRIRLFLREILQLHQRFLIAFLYFFGLILSGNEQFALRQSLGHLLSPEPWVVADLIYLSCLLLYGWVVAAVVRWSARGGRVHHLAESLPLPFAWERLIRVMNLSFVNLTILFLGGMQKGAPWPWALLLGAAYYIGILGLQLSLLEYNWRIFPVWILGALLLVLSKGSPLIGPMLALTVILALWGIRRQESRTHDHPELPLGTWEMRCRAAITRRFPPSLMMQIAYALAKPALLIYCSLLASGLLIVLWMVLKQSVPVSQKIYVYTCITGIISIILSSFFRNFFLQRQERQTWLNSLPREDGWWLRQDSFFVVLLYGLLTGPISLALIVQEFIPAPIPFMILPVHGMGFILLRRMQRSRHMENGILFVMGFCVWFLALAYLCDHGLQWMAGLLGTLPTTPGV